jgi:DNA-directed RNA polymerase specialized sigma24 family protein
MANPAGYLYRVGQSRTRRKKAPVVYESNPVGEPAIEPQLAAAIADLSKRQRICVVLAYGFEWTYAEIAETLEVGESTVRRHVERGLDRLRKFIVKEERRDA